MPVGGYDEDWRTDWSSPHTHNSEPVGPAPNTAEPKKSRHPVANRELRGTAEPAGFGTAEPAGLTHSVGAAFRRFARPAGSTEPGKEQIASG